MKKALIVMVMVIIAVFSAKFVWAETAVDAVVEMGESSSQGVVLNQVDDGDVIPSVGYVITDTVDIRISHSVPVTVTGTPNCDTYIPDSLLGQFPGIPFSHVSDWSFEWMLGATPQDGWPQVLCRSVTGTGSFAGAYDTNGHAEMYVAWRQVPGIPTETPVPTVEPTPIPTPSPTPTQVIDPRTDVDADVSLPREQKSQSIVLTNLGQDSKGTVKLNGNGKFSFRVASPKPLQVLDGSSALSCDVYVPDVMAADFPSATRFGNVTDWSFERMLGATAADAWFQTICRKVKLPQYLVSETSEFPIVSVPAFEVTRLPLIGRYADPRSEVDLQVNMEDKVGNLGVQRVLGNDGQFTVRLESEDRYDFRVTSLEVALVLTENSRVNCEVYVPDSFPTYSGAIRFSQVGDWSFEHMLGASSNDGWPQVICRDKQGPLFVSSPQEMGISWRRVDR